MSQKTFTLQAIAGKYRRSCGGHVIAEQFKTMKLKAHASQNWWEFGDFIECSLCILKGTTMNLSYINCVLLFSFFAAFLIKKETGMIIHIIILRPQIEQTRYNQSLLCFINILPSPFLSNLGIWRCYSFKWIVHIYDAFIWGVGGCSRYHNEKDSQKF